MVEIKKIKKINTVSYQNKDITSKILGEGLREKSLAVYGISVPKIIDVLPTNLPAIEANELRMDNLFKLADGSYALIDYESKYRSIDKLKYLGYIVRTAKRLHAAGIRTPRIRMIVIYTSNVKTVDTNMNLGCLQFHIEPGYLAYIDTTQVLHTLEQKISNQELLTDEETMLMIVLPLTVSGKENQQPLLKKVISLAKDLPDEHQQVFVLSGIITFSDKIINKNDSEEIRRWIYMTKVGRLFEEEKQAAVKEAIRETKKEMKLEMKKQIKKYQDQAKDSDNKARALETRAKTAEDEARTAENKARTAELRVCILQMLLKGDSIPVIADRLHLKASDVAALIEE